MLDFIIRLKLQFSDEEKNSCLSIAKRMIELAQVAHDQGIFGLAATVSKDNSNDYTIMAVDVLILGYDSATLRKILEYTLTTTSYTGKQMLERLIIGQALISIVDNLGLGHCDDRSLFTRIVAVSVGVLLGESYVHPLLQYAESLENS